MSLRKLKLYEGSSGPELRGNADGDALVWSEADDAWEAGQVAPVSQVVASFFADVPDTSLEPAINGVFYTVPEGKSGWYRLSAVLRPAAITTDASLAPTLGYVGPAVTQVSPQFQFRASSEGGLATTILTPADFYLAAGEALTMSAPQALSVIVGVRLELVTLGP